MQIASHLPAIIELIGSHPVTSIVAPTGSGKSVGVPAAVAAAGLRCFVTVPTRTSAISLAEYQKSLQSAADPDLNVNAIIGYAAEGQIHYTAQTRIAYVTGGHARKKILSYFEGGQIRPLDFCELLMVDEVHSGSLDTTIIISLWMVAYHAGVQVPRLVIASATPVPMEIDPHPLEYKVVLNHNRIEYTYLSREIDIDDPAGSLYLQTANLAAEIHRNSPVASGHILIFAPGSFEVETIANSLQKLLADPLPDRTAVIIPAFGALQQDKIGLIYRPAAAHERKIVIATNIAEMSITIPDVAHVIDTMMEKRAETSGNGGLRLALHRISQDSAIQRAGRAGRTGTVIGVCHRMCTRTQYDKLEKHRPPEIDRVPIYDVIMELLDVGLHPTEVLRGIETQRINSAITMLTQLKMIQSIDGSIVVNPSGHFGPNFQLSVQNAAFLWEWFNYTGRRFSSKIIAAAADLFGLNYEILEIDPTSEFSSLTPFQMAQVTAVYESENLQPRWIIDATANIGGDSINFLRLYPEAELRSIEINPQIARILRRNFENLNTILGTSIRYQATAIQSSARTYLAEPRRADLIFFDPPWGGPGYKELERVPLELDGESLGLLVGDILAKGMTPLVIIKAPANYDAELFEADVGPEASFQIHQIRNEITREISYNLIFIRRTDVPLIEVESPIRPPSVPLVPATLPTFPGIVTAALIDSYGPPYFRMPRQSSNESREAYNRSLEAHKAKYFERYKGANDLETALNLWHDLMKEFKTIDPNQRELASWTRSRSLNLTKIKELLHVIRQGVKSSQRLGYPVKIGPMTTAGVLEKARPLLRTIYANNTLIQSDGTKYFNPVTREQFRLDDRNAVSQMLEIPPIGVIALNSVEIKTGGGSFRLVSFGLDTDKDGLGRPIVLKSKPSRGSNRVLVNHRPSVLSAANQAEIQSAANLLSELMLGPSTLFSMPASEPSRSRILASITPSGPALETILARGPLNPPPESLILASWLRNEDRAEVSASTLIGASARTIAAFFRRHLVEYPLRRRYRTLEEAQNSFAALTHYVPNWDTSAYGVSEKLDLPLRLTFESPGADSNQYIRLPNNWETYAEIDWLVDYFIEASRIHCSRKGKKSPFAAWSDYGSYVENGIQKILDQKQDLTLDNLREHLYADKSIPECPHEKSSFLRSLFELLGIPNPSIFDGSAGWGDRLVAAMSIGARYYVGIDPNQRSQSGFKAMVETLGRLILPDDSLEELHTRYSVLPLSMPDAILPELATPESFDIAFLSPPSFDSEVYSEDPGQSVARWADEGQWYLNFMYPTLARCWSLIRPGGYFIVQSILINRIAPYIEATFPDAFYCGPISVQVSTRNKPMWIWCKVGPEYLTVKQQRESERLKATAGKIMTRTLTVQPPISTKLSGLVEPQAWPGLGPGGQFELDLSTLGPAKSSQDRRGHPRSLVGPVSTRTGAQPIVRAKPSTMSSVSGQPENLAAASLLASLCLFSEGPSTSSRPQSIPRTTLSLIPRPTSGSQSPSSTAAASLLDSLCLFSEGPSTSATPSLIPRSSATPSLIPRPSATPSLIPRPSATPSLIPRPSATPSLIPRPSATPTPSSGSQTSNLTAAASLIDSLGIF